MEAPKNNRKKRRPKVFLVWPQEYKLSEHFAKALGFELLLIQVPLWRGARLPFPIRYINQSVRTLLWLVRHRPSFVYIQSPPLMAALVVAFYCFFFRSTRYGIDHHSVFFREQKWQFFHALAKPITRLAAINSAHNVYDLQTLLSWNATAMEMQFINPVYDLARLNKPLQNKHWEELLRAYPMSVFMVNRFAKNDDDYTTVIRAASKRQDWLFFVTGECSNVLELDTSQLPPNLICTGYLMNEEFLKLMKRCTVILSLTLREKTILWSVREAMALGKVFVTSDTEAMRQYFGPIGIFAARKSSDHLLEKIEYAANHKYEYEEKIRKFLEKDNTRAKEQVERIRRIINSAISRE